ncbi:MAG TPA: ABC transporter substrate-binding protein [Mesorhizobium sp.]
MIRHSITKSVAAALIGLALLSGQAAAQNAFDFSPEQKDRPRTQSNPEAVKAIPADFKFVREGYLTVAIAPFAPPISTYATDAKTVVGADPDYARLVAESLGLQLDLQPIAWADWPLGLTSGKYDAVISNVGVTEARKEKFDFSTYRLGLHGFYVKKDSRIQKIAEPKDVAGLRIITGSGTNQERIILEWDRRNREAGLPPISLQYYDDQAAIWLALASGRADVNFNPNGPQAYEAASKGAIRQVGTVNAGWPLKSDVAIATRKGSGLANALTIATNSLIRDGSYEKFLKRWNLGEEGLPASETNPPGLPQY